MNAIYNLRFFLLFSMMVCLSLDNVSGTDQNETKPFLSRDWSSSSRSTGYFAPRVQYETGSSEESDTFSDLFTCDLSGIDKKTAYHACVYNVFGTFQQIQNDKGRAEYALTSLTDSHIQNSHGRGYFNMLKDYVHAGRFTPDPLEFCWPYKNIPPMFDECNSKIVVFGSTKKDAIENLYSHYTLSSSIFEDKSYMLRNHLKEYRNNILNNFYLLANIPTPQKYCRILNDYKIRYDNDYEPYIAYKAAKEKLLKIQKENNKN